MENISNKFYLFLLNKNEEFLKTEEIEKYFEEFKKMWNLNVEFKNIYKTLKQQKSIIFVFNKTWKILSKKEKFEFKEKELNRQTVIEKYLIKNNINWYYGLSTAKYYLKINWQTPIKYYIINDKYNKKIKIDNTELILKKIKKKYFIKSSILKINDKNVSNLEKTYLDEIYFKEKNISFNEEMDLDLINLYLNVYDDKEIRTYLNLNLPKNKLK